MKDMTIIPVFYDINSQIYEIYVYLVNFITINIVGTLTLFNYRFLY